MGSATWGPNRSGAAAFVAQDWPRVRAVCPGARLHVFSLPALAPASDGVEAHPAPAQSREAFPAGAVLVVPLAVASGVRMKVLEAWARGVAVVATPAAAAGLGAEPGRELLVAEGAAGFAGAIRQLAGEPGLGPALVAAGRALLRRRHDPAAVARTLAGIYAEVAGSGAAPGVKKKS
jgi:glycosyltransferase involved in cell wall biosynthesis